MSCPREACAGEALIVVWEKSDVVVDKGQLRNIRNIHSRFEIQMLLTPAQGTESPLLPFALWPKGTERIYYISDLEWTALIL